MKFPLRLSLFFCVLFAGCPDDPVPARGPGSGSDAGDAQRCENDTQCEAGYRCENSACVANTSLSDGGAQETSDAGPGEITLDAGQGEITLDAGQGEITLDAGPQRPAVSPWLLSVNNSVDTLVKIDAVTGDFVTLCSFVPGTANYPSTTFGLNGTLYGWNGNNKTLDIIDPCNCQVTEVGNTVDADNTPYNNLPGITADGNKVETLFGLSTDWDLLVEVSVDTGLVEPIGPLGLNFHYSGTTWSTELEGLYAINNLTDKLYEINTTSGQATDIADLDIDVTLVGIEYHIGVQQLFTCTNAGGNGISRVYQVEIETGNTTVLSTLNYSCNNLAAPWTPISCVDEFPME